MQAFEVLGRLASGNADVELGPECALLRIRALETALQGWILGGGAGEALDPACRLESRDGCNEPWTGQIERRREGSAVVSVRCLLRNRRKAVRAALSNSPKGA